MAKRRDRRFGLHSDELPPEVPAEPPPKTRLCPGCQCRKDPNDFYTQKPQGGRARAYVCGTCRRYGPKKLARDDETPADALSTAPLSLRDRALLKCLADGMEIGEAEKACGYRIGGAVRKKLLFSEDFRIGFQAIMLEAGVDRDALVEAVKGGLEAKDVRWNPVEKEYQEIGPDHSARLRAADLGSKWLDLQPRNHQVAGAGATVVIVNTNLGHGPKAEPTGEYVIEVKPVAAEEAKP